MNFAVRSSNATYVGTHVIFVGVSPNLFIAIMLIVERQDFRKLGMRLKRSGHNLFEVLSQNLPRG
jgi:hypothetical protein